MTPEQERDIARSLLELMADAQYRLRLLRNRRPTSHILAAAEADALLVQRRLRQFVKALKAREPTPPKPTRRPEG